MKFQELSDAEKAYFVLAIGEVLLVEENFTAAFYLEIMSTPVEGFKFRPCEKKVGKRVCKSLVVEIDGRSFSQTFAENVLLDTGFDLAKEFLGRVIWGRRHVIFDSDLLVFAILLRDVAVHPEDVSLRIARDGDKAPRPLLTKASSPYLLGEVIAPGLIEVLFDTYRRIAIVYPVPRLSDVAAQSHSGHQNAPYKNHILG